MSFLTEKSIVNDEGKIIVSEKMLKKLGIKKWDLLQLTATKNLIIIEKCEGEDNGNKKF